MSKDELIKNLLKHDLNVFRFSVWATYNDCGSLKYALCLKGSKSEVYDIHLCDIGGVPDIDYTYDYIDFCIGDAIDEEY